MSNDFLDALNSLEELIPSNRRASKVEVLPTGVEDLDNLLGGGIPIGKITEIYGTPDSCKSALSYNILKATVDKEGYAVLIDTEDRYSPEWWDNWDLRVESQLLAELDLAKSSSLPEKGSVIPLEEIEELRNLVELDDVSSFYIKNIDEGTWIVTDNSSTDHIYNVVLDDETLRVIRRPNLRYFFCSIIEEAEEIIDKLIQWGHTSNKNKPLTIVLDSYDGVPSKAETESEVKDIFKGRIAAKPSAFGVFVSRWMGWLSGYKFETGNNSNISIIILNHAKTDFHYGAFYSTGGSKFKHLQYTRLLLRAGAKIDPAKNHGGGFLVTAKVERNKAAAIPDGITTEFRFLQPDQSKGAKARFAKTETKTSKTARSKIPGFVIQSLEEVEEVM